MKKFSKKIDEATCIFCGAPLTSNDRCNYCGCEYITQEAIEKIIHNIDLPNLIELDVYVIDVEDDIINHQSNLIHFRGACVAALMPIHNPKINITLINNDFNYIRTIFNSNTMHDYKLNFYNHTILAKHAIMTQISNNIDGQYNCTKITLLPDKVMTS